MELQRIKSLTIKSQQMAATPELYLKKISPLFSTPTFDPRCDIEEKQFLPTSKDKNLPQLIPTNNHLKNYISFHELYNELVYTKAEHKLSENTFCSHIVHQTDEGS